MKASRKRPKGAFRRPFGLVLCVVIAMPNSIGHQDLAALIARQPAVTERWRAHVRNSTFGTIHAASLSFPRLVGASIPDPYFTQLAALDPRALEATGSIPLNVPIDPMVAAPVYDFPVVDRRLKGDRLNVKAAPPAQPQPVRPQAPSKSKDMVSRPPASEPSPLSPQRQPELVVSQPALPKGDRFAPSQVSTDDAPSARTYRRSGLAAGQDTRAKRALGTVRRKPFAVAAPAQPVTDQVVRRAGIAAGETTLAKRALGTMPRKPVEVAEAAHEMPRRVGLAPGQDTLAKRILGTVPRPPVVVAAPVEPVADMVVRRAGLAAGQDTLAKRMLGLGPRKPALVAAKPVEVIPAPVASVEAEVTVVSAPARPFRPAGLAAAHLHQVRSEAKRLAEMASRTPPAETADLESQRADLRGPIVPPRAQLVETADLESQRADLRGPIVPPRAQLAETADLESQRADLRGPIVPPPAPVADVPPAVAPQAAPAAAPAPAPDAPAPEPQPQVADIPSEPDSRVAQAAPPEPDTASAAVETVPAPAAAEVVPAAPEKTPDRFNAQAAEQLAQYVRPGAQTRIFFGTRELGVGRSEWEAWEPDEVPTVLAPPHVDTEIKRAALDPSPDAETEKGGETIAPKGEVTGEGKRPRTPAERLSLTGAVRVKHEKCLANAIYFEARGEVERGQMAVAQVILNRAFSGYYPGNVCDVVYQNAHRHLACQFTFACDNHKDVVRDLPRWEIATRIAADALDGKFWLPEIGKATHYHATYVNPWWVRTMTKHSRIGVHIFYRPTRWGSLDEIPVWGERLEATGSIKRAAQPVTPEKKNDDKRADAQPSATPARRSIFDPVEPINLPGG
jgi:spore germination cell wall hydrolase CwlJ-like protein